MVVKKSAKVTKKKASKKVAQVEQKQLDPVPAPAPTPGYPMVSVKCRRGNDRLTEGQSCNSLQAENMSLAPGSTIFRCTKCQFTWQVSTGGHFPY